MRRYKKKEVSATLEMLKKVNCLVTAKPELSREELRGVLADCQEAALEIGRQIEEEGGDTAAVALLEEYCEYLYRWSEAKEDWKSCERWGRQAGEILEKVKDSVWRGLPDSKREVVFLPYKASMWDSLESVWEAACEDESCQTHVIPIPYFDRNADRSLGQMHEEGNQFPDYVPITSWLEYQIPKRHPDEIYIHNPYDDHNYVTSVHPCFYAEELKKYTDMLIYIPYFVCLDDVPDHFCALPGTLYADKVIVESEKVRDTYIREFHKFEEKNGCRGAFGKAEEKFLALGSPKYDKVIKTKRREVRVPAAWLELLKEGKKVVLYNTTIDGLLKHDEKMLSKIESSLEIFHKNKGIVLLWRPHPLNQATVASLRPGMLTAYQEVVNRYRAAGWGILDETADLNRAIAISDAYYGDWSSVAALYRKTGKPVLIQNVGEGGEPE